MGREHPFKCKHGTLMGGDESFGVQDNRCLDCEVNKADFEAMEQRIKELESRVKLLLSSTQSWEAVAADKQAKIEELEGENERLKEELIDSHKITHHYSTRTEKAESKLEAVREIIYGNFDGETCYHLIKDIIKEKA